MRINGLIFFIFFFFEEAIGQTPIRRDSTILYMGTGVHYGYIIPHRQAIRPLLKDTNPWGISAEISRLRYTSSAWNACNCYSQNGLAISYFNFDKSVLGSSLSLVAFAEPHLSFNRFNVMLRGGLGLSYLTKLFDLESNPDNVLFSSRLSGILLLQLTTRFWVSDNFGLRLSASYHHISNGGMQQPNLGMNFPTISVGADYSMGRVRLVPRRKYCASNKTLQYYAGSFFTTSKVSTNDDRRKPVLGLSGGFYKRFLPMHGIGMGIEFVNDWSLKERNKQVVEYIDHRIVSGLLRHHLLFGKFDFSQAIGFYLYKKYPTPQDIFQRYALHYRITENLELGFSMKAHLAVAEQMDVRINYLF